MHPDLATKISRMPARQMVVAAHGPGVAAVADPLASRSLMPASVRAAPLVVVGGAAVAVPAGMGPRMPLFDDYCPTPRLSRMLRSWAGLVGMGLLIAAGTVVAVCAVAGAILYLAGAVLALGNALIALGTGLIMVAIGVPLCMAMLSAQTSSGSSSSSPPRRYRRP